MEHKKTILVTGANGQLGNEMRLAAAGMAEHNFVFVTKETLPINDAAAIDAFFQANQVEYCVNCAAYTAVDRAETESEQAFRVNAIAVGNLAAACHKAGARLIHVSTDYVFDGTGTRPYLEDDPVNPVNVYGASKLKGEQLALQNDSRSIIIRTSWVYSSFGNNFVKTMMRLMSQRSSLNVVSDQQGSPTYAADLAKAILHIVGQLERPGEKVKAGGIYNFSNTGITTWHQFAVAIAEISGSNCAVNPIPASQYPTPATRPSYSVLDTSRIRREFALEIPEWRSSLETCMQILQQQLATAS